MFLRSIGRTAFVFEQPAVLVFVILVIFRVISLLFRLISPLLRRLSFASRVGFVEIIFCALSFNAPALPRARRFAVRAP